MLLVVPPFSSPPMADIESLLTTNDVGSSAHRSDQHLTEIRTAYDSTNPWNLWSPMTRPSSRTSSAPQAVDHHATGAPSSDRKAPPPHGDASTTMVRPCLQSDSRRKMVWKRPPR